MKNKHSFSEDLYSALAIAFGVMLIVKGFTDWVMVAFAITIVLVIGTRWVERQNPRNWRWVAALRARLRRQSPTGSA